MWTLVEERVIGVGSGMAFWIEASGPGKWRCQMSCAKALGALPQSWGRFPALARLKCGWRSSPEDALSS